MKNMIPIIWPQMFIHGAMETLQHTIRNHAFNPSIASGYEVKRQWRQIQKDIKETMKEMNREISRRKLE
jgi:hypothetical protein